MRNIRAIVAATGLVLACHSIAAQAPSEKPKPIGILLAAGDISTCGKKTWHGYANKTAEIIRKVIKESEPAIPVRVLALGDLAYDKGTTQQFKCYQKRWSEFDNVLLPIPGNHEYLTADAADYSVISRRTPTSIRAARRRGISL